MQKRMNSQLHVFRLFELLPQEVLRQLPDRFVDAAPEQEQQKHRNRHRGDESEHDRVGRDRAGVFGPRPL